MHVGCGTFFQNLGNARPDAEVYAHELSMADLAEPLGFDSVWAAEHHFTDYTMCPDPSQLLTWLAGRTSRGYKDSGAGQPVVFRADLLSFISA